MSWKSIVTTGLLCLIAAPAWAVPSLRVTPSQTVMGGDRQWLIEVVPEAGDLPTSLAIELAFSHVPLSSTQAVGIIDNAATSNNNQAGNVASSFTDTFYFKTNQAAYIPPTVLNGTDGNGVWVTNDFDDVGTPGVDETNEQNVGANPFTGTNTEGLYVSGANVFAALGSVVLQPGTTGVKTLNIVTDGGGGALRLVSGVIKYGNDAADELILSQTDYYVPGDYNGDGQVGPPDLSLLLFNFNDPYTQDPAWDGFREADGVVGPSDLSNLLFNFNAGIGFGGGGIATPEPAGGVLLILGASMVGVIGKRRAMRRHF